MKFSVSRSVLHNSPVQPVSVLVATPGLRWGSEVKPIRQSQTRDALTDFTGQERRKRTTTGNIEYLFHTLFNSYNGQGLKTCVSF